MLLERSVPNALNPFQILARLAFLRASPNHVFRVGIGKLVDLENNWRGWRID